MNTKLKIKNNGKIGVEIEKYFLKVDKSLIKENVKIGDIFGLEVVEIGDKITLELVKTKESEKGAERVRFYECFRYNNDDSLESVRNIQIGGLKMDRGVKLGKGILFGGIDFSLFIGRDLSVIKEKDYWIVIGLY